MSAQRRIAVIGSGISGLAAAHRLCDPREPNRAAVTLFEAGSHFGGHTHTVDVTLPGAHGPATHGVDTGFLVFNHRTYPKLVALFDELGVASVASEMSFSVQVPDAGLEWSGCDLGSVFAQRRNLLRPGFWRMLIDLLRFNRVARALAERGDGIELEQSIGDFLREQRFSGEFRDWYLLPMLGCIWSCPTDQMLRFPVATMVRFCHNHGLIQITDRPQWYTVRGGAKHYVDKLLQRLPDVRLATPVLQVLRSEGGVQVVTRRGGTERFDEVVFACHSDQALALLADAAPAERAVLGAIRYHANHAVLHTDTSVLPTRRRAWAAWNYERAASDSGEQVGVCLHYWINRLQPLPFAQDVVVSLNPGREPAPASVLGRFDYAHPVFDAPALAAQRRLPEIQGRRRSWYCGAWTGYGFHEDGLTSGLAVAEALLGEAGAPERHAAPRAQREIA
ncbi:MAG: FAD-dependent oxidoreductase [Methylibium sp.]|uniref:NAD(P)/FAD-dependent oxidoreductase n=1 Tax=Methylibium sp. TaxID=2067992 RepID=UPI0017ED9210|nr:FAD-dependent oxidoreductase [Methylibium sp.]MBA3596675.1 FAD-dependent oxidoreductase [Methylibium sp.]